MLNQLRDTAILETVVISAIVGVAFGGLWYVIIRWKFGPPFWPKCDEPFGD